MQRTLEYIRDNTGNIDLKSSENDRIFVEASTYFPDKDNLFFPFAESFSWSDGDQRYYTPTFRHLRREIDNLEAYTIFPNTLRTPQKPTNDRQLSSTGDNLASLFKFMTSGRRSAASSRSEILDAMKLVLPNLENIQIQSIGGLMVPIFRMKEKNDRIHKFNVSQVSDGTLRVLGLLTALHQPFAPSTIALEEPEQNINPAILQILAETVKGVAQRHQVLITTHSPELIDYFDEDSIFAVEYDDGLTKVGEIAAYQRDAVKDKLTTLGELMTIEGLVTG